MPYRELITNDTIPYIPHTQSTERKRKNVSPHSRRRLQCFLSLNKFEFHSADTTKKKYIYISSNMENVPSTTTLFQFPVLSTI